VRVRCDAPVGKGQNDKDTMEKRLDELKDRLGGIQNQMDKRMKTLEDNVATLQQNVDRKLGALERMLSELLAAKMT
jgi:anion-transporting  ArsA/GET3 family ATPase